VLTGNHKEKHYARTNQHRAAGRLWRSRDKETCSYMPSDPSRLQTREEMRRYSSYAQSCPINRLLAFSRDSLCPQAEGVSLGSTISPPRHPTCRSGERSGYAIGRLAPKELRDKVSDPSQVNEHRWPRKSLNARTTKIRRVSAINHRKGLRSHHAPPRLFLPPVLGPGHVRMLVPLRGWRRPIRRALDSSRAYAARFALAPKSKSLA
jgi:hypothetical protein